MSGRYPISAHHSAFASAVKGRRIGKLTQLHLSQSFIRIAVPSIAHYGHSPLNSCRPVGEQAWGTPELKSMTVPLEVRRKPGGYEMLTGLQKTGPFYCDPSAGTFAWAALWRNERGACPLFSCSS